MTVLTSKEKAAWRNAAQKLKPAVHIGKRGITAALLVEFEKCLSSEPLVKVAFKADRSEIPALVEALESKASCHCVGGVGKRRSFIRAKAEWLVNAGSHRVVTAPDWTVLRLFEPLQNLDGHERFVVLGGAALGECVDDGEGVVRHGLDSLLPDFGKPFRKSIDPQHLA